MRAPISVIVPTLNAAGDLPATLTSLFEGLEAGLIGELIVTDGGSTDHTRAIADDAGAVWIEGAASRGGQLRRGAEAARCEWFLFLHADTRLEQGWSGVVRDALDAQAAFHFRLRFRASGVAPTVVAGWANLRSQVFKLPYGDQGLLVHRKDYAAVGGYPDQPLMEDVAMSRALRRRLRELPVQALTCAERYKRDGWLRRGARNVSILLRYRLGVSPERLAQSYSRSGSSSN